MACLVYSVSTWYVDTAAAAGWHEHYSCMQSAGATTYVSCPAPYPGVEGNLQDGGHLCQPD
jgi:hypothetical protein